MKNFVEYSKENHNGQWSSSEYLIVQMDIIIQCLIEGNVNACNANASDETCSYVCDALIEIRKRTQSAKLEAFVRAYDEWIEYRLNHPVGQRVLSEIRKDDYLLEALENARKETHVTKEKIITSTDKLFSGGLSSFKTMVAELYEAIQKRDPPEVIDAAWKCVGIHFLNLEGTNGEMLIGQSYLNWIANKVIEWEIYCDLYRKRG